MLAIIWPEIVKKRNKNKLCNNIYRRSLPYKTDSVTIIFQHMVRQSPLYFLNNKIVEFRYFILIFVQNLQLFMFTGL